MELVVVSRGAGFEEVRAVSVDSSHKKSNSVGPLGCLLSFDLGFQLEESILQAILKMSRLRGWLLPYVSLQLRDQLRMYLQRTRASAVSPEMVMPMLSSTLNNFYWQQASSEGNFFRLQRTTCELLLSPRQMEPCLTASIAYSTWKSFPWGDQVTQSKSQSPFSILSLFKYFLNYNPDPILLSFAPTVANLLIQLFLGNIWGHFFDALLYWQKGVEGSLITLLWIIRRRPPWRRRRGSLMKILRMRIFSRSASTSFSTSLSSDSSKKQPGPSISGSGKKKFSSMPKDSPTCTTNSTKSKIRLSR